MTAAVRQLFEDEIDRASRLTKSPLLQRLQVADSSASSAAGKSAGGPMLTMPDAGLASSDWHSDRLDPVWARRGWWQQLQHHLRWNLARLVIDTRFPSEADRRAVFRALEPVLGAKGQDVWFSLAARESLEISDPELHGSVQALVNRRQEALAMLVLGASQLLSRRAAFALASDPKDLGAVCIEAAASYLTDSESDIGIVVEPFLRAAPRDAEIKAANGVGVFDFVHPSSPRPPSPLAQPWSAEVA